MTHFVDYGEYAPNSPEGKGASAQQVLEQIQRLVAEADDYERKRKQAEADAKQWRQAHEELTIKQIPSMMRDAGVDEVRTSSGVTVKISEKMRHSVTADRKDAAYNWLEEHGYGDVIKRQVSVQFGLDETQQAEEAAEAFSAITGKPATVERKVEPSTLRKVLKELVSRRNEGDTSVPEVPADLFGLYQWEQAELSAKE